MRQSTKLLCLSVIAFLLAGWAMLSDNGLTNTVLPLFMIVAGIGGIYGWWDERRMEKLERRVRGK